MNPKKTITFCICTYNRNLGLSRLLESINKICIPRGLNDNDLQVVIVDNYDGRSKPIIKKHKENFRFSINWFHEVNKGLTFARNRTVKMSGNSEFCLFMDDDQIIEKYCVVELLETIKKTHSVLAYGSNPPIYEEKAAESMDVFFMPKYDKKEDYPIAVAPTNCTLIKKSVLDEIEGPFDMTFNLTGGEDSYLTRQIGLKGYKMFRSVRAKAFELIPPDRTSLRWLTKRHFRCSTSLTIQDRKMKLGKRFYLKRGFKALVKIFTGFALTPFTLILPSSCNLKFRFWIEGIEGLGHIVGYFNYQPKEYK